MARLSVSVKGIDELVKRLDASARSKVASETAKVTETYTRKMANESAENAPVKSSLLRNSIVASPRKSDAEGVWEWGSNVAYARRQEYEHKSRKGFIRKAVWNNREPYRKAIRKSITEELN